MNKISILFAALCFSAASAMAQQPVPEPDTLRDPVKQTDPELKALPQDRDKYHKEDLKITPAEMPAAIRQTLDASTQYSGWEKGRLYKNKSGNKFIIEITKGDTTRMFTFDKLGRPVKE